MKYEVRAKSLAQAVAASVRSGKVPLQKKSSETIYAEPGGNYEYETIYASVEGGFTYTISWSAQKRAGEGAIYGIDIRSRDGNGTYREAFRSSGSWSFRARGTGEVSFKIGVSYSSGNVFGSYPVDIDIN